MWWKYFNHSQGIGDFQAYIAETAQRVPRQLLTLAIFFPSWKIFCQLLQKKFTIFLNVIIFSRENPIHESGNICQYCKTCGGGIRLASFSSSSEVTNGNRVLAETRRSAGCLESIEVFVNLGVVQT
jgi:hypothetical protein